MSSSFSTLARSGVKTTVLTNSLEATDVPAVHAGLGARHCSRQASACSR